MTHAQPQADLAASRHAVVAQAFEAFGQAFGRFVDQRMAAYLPDAADWAAAAADRMGRPAGHAASDPLFQLLVVRRFWGPVFAASLPADLREVVGDLIEVRNRWAHLDLPDDAGYVERCLLGIERLLAPVDADAAGAVRALRGGLRRPPTPAAAAEVDVAHLAAQLSEAEAAFDALKHRHERLVGELAATRRAAAAKQLRLSSAERDVAALQGLSSALEGTIAAERDLRSRREWLFVGLVAVLVLVMALLAR